MPALFRIVQDDYPPLPEGVSPALKDWLMQCFQKDPVLRISAQKLLNHKWIKAKRKDVIPAEISENPEQIILQHNIKVEQLKNAPLKDIPAPKPGLKSPFKDDDDFDFDDFDKPLSLKTPASPAPEKPEKPAKPDRPKKNKDDKNNNNNKSLVATLRRNEEVAQPKKSYVEDDDDDWGDDFGTPTPSKLDKLKLGEPKVALKDKEKSPLSLSGSRPKSSSVPTPPNSKDKDPEKPNGLGKWQEKDDDWDELGGKLGKLAIKGSMGKSTGSTKKAHVPGGSVVYFRRNRG
jgi:hypothetical protein